MAATATPRTPRTHGALALLLLLTPLATAFSCNPLRLQDTTFPWDSLQLLRTMAPSPQQPCPHLHTLLPFPDTLLNTNDTHQAAATALHILQHLFSTLSSPSVPAQWLGHARHDLLNRIQHFIHHLQQCFAANGRLVQRRGPRNLHLNINKYFRRIRHFLQNNNYSPCAWDHVRLEAHACFRRMDALIQQMK
ncbi:IFN protein, partial [Chauna torquata]|nr:IFN protein [Chauna torquata]